MQRLITYAVVLAVAVGVVGWYRNWFTISSHRQGSEQTHVELVVNNKNWKHDRDTFLAKAGPLIGQLETKLNKLIARSQNADPMTKAALDSQIQNLQKQHDDAKQDLTNLTNAGQGQWDASKGQALDRKLTDLHSGVNQALSQYEPVP